VTLHHQTPTPIQTLVQARIPVLVEVVHPLPVLVINENLSTVDGVQFPAHQKGTLGLPNDAGLVHEYPVP
jgi:hypothetical protein